jgi:hypothetical protein
MEMPNQPSPEAVTSDTQAPGKYLWIAPRLVMTISSGGRARRAAPSAHPSFYRALNQHQFASHNCMMQLT